MQLNVIDAAKPLLILSKLFGIGMFTIDKKSFRVSLKKCDFVSICFAIVFNTSMFYMYFKVLFLIDIHKSEVLRTGFPKLVLINYVLNLFTVFWMFIRRHKMAATLCAINEIDIQFSSLKINFDYHQHRKYLIRIIVYAFLFSFTGIVLCLISQVYYNMAYDYKASLFTLWGFYFSSIFAISFIAILIAIKQRFSAINSYLK